MCRSARYCHSVPRRSPIPESIKHRVLTEAGYRCAVPTCRTILAVDLHHLDRIADGGSDSEGNLLALCPTCHRLHHRGDIPAEALRVYKGVLVSLNEGSGREAKDLLLLLSMDAGKLHFSWHTSDGVLRFAPLIVAGLVEVRAAPFANVKSGAMWPGAYLLGLTERGSAVTAAWMSGSIDALRIAQTLGNALNQHDADGSQ